MAPLDFFINNDNGMNDDMYLFTATGMATSGVSAKCDPDCLDNISVYASASTEPLQSLFKAAHQMTPLSWGFVTSSRFTDCFFSF